jgi:hypothetical protein
MIFAIQVSPVEDKLKHGKRKGRESKLATQIPHINTPTRTAVPNPVILTPLGIPVNTIFTARQYHDRFVDRFIRESAGRTAVTACLIDVLINYKLYH